MENTALVIIDLINEIVHPDGKFAGFGYPEAVKRREIVARTNAAITAARARGVPVVFVRVGFPADYGNCPAASPLFGAAKQYGALQLGTWATEFHADLNVGANDFVVVKPRVSALYGTTLESLLRSRRITTVMLGGVATDLAVQTTARDAHDRDYEVVVLEDLCAAATDAEHEQTIAALGKVAKVALSGDVFGQ